MSEFSVGSSGEIAIVEDSGPAVREREAFEWQQEIGYALGNQWGAQVLSLEECIEKIRELRVNRWRG
ncbi:UNVERIFIED_ORG: hypothetical protein M2328_006110 [Rhodococcus erythropolis]